MSILKILVLQIYLHHKPSLYNVMIIRFLAGSFLAEECSRFESCILWSSRLLWSEWHSKMLKQCGITINKYYKLIPSNRKDIGRFKDQNCSPSIKKLKIWLPQTKSHFIKRSYQCFCPSGWKVNVCCLSNHYEDKSIAQLPKRFT